MKLADKLDAREEKVGANRKTKGTARLRHGGIGLRRVKIIKFEMGNKSRRERPRRREVAPASRKTPECDICRKTIISYEREVSYEELAEFFHTDHASSLSPRWETSLFMKYSVLKITTSRRFRDPARDTVVFHRELPFLRRREFLHRA